MEFSVVDQDSSILLGGRYWGDPFLFPIPCSSSLSLSSTCFLSLPPSHSLFPSPSCSSPQKDLLTTPRANSRGRTGFIALPAAVCLSVYPLQGAGEAEGAFLSLQNPLGIISPDVFSQFHPHMVGNAWCKGDLSGRVTRITKYNFMGHMQLALKLVFLDPSSHFKFWSAFVSQVPCTTRLHGAERFLGRHYRTFSLFLSRSLSVANFIFLKSEHNDTLLFMWKIDNEQ